MPASGGAADKLGNAYERLWAIQQLLRIVRDEALEFISEPLNPEESQGVEFRLATGAGVMEYWSVKRQNSSGKWSIAALAEPGAHGRSVLGDLRMHVERGVNHLAVFASAVAASELQELCDHAKDAALLDGRLARSLELRRKFERVQSVCAGDREATRRFLLATRTRVVDPRTLRDETDGMIRLLFAAKLGPLDVAAVHGHLEELLLEYLHRPISKAILTEWLRGHGISHRQLVPARAAGEQLAAICSRYIAPIRRQQINGEFLEIDASKAVFDPGATPGRLLVVAGAGRGKSTVIADAVRRRRDAGVDCVVVRFDELPDAATTSRELGRAMGLDESPVLVLASVAAGKPCTLVIDQLDAVSVASGRRTEALSLFDELIHEAAFHPEMSVLVGCREFDLRHDPRLRSLSADASGWTTVQLGPLTAGQVEEVLRVAGLEPAKLSSGLRAILTTPLHLALLLQLDATERSEIQGRDGLFDAYWRSAERRVSNRLGRPSAWTDVIKTLAEWLSSAQQIAAPDYVLDRFADNVAAMVSEGVLEKVGPRIRFFHESFFDYAFARTALAAGTRVLDLLLAGEQSLFVRAQVRQYFSFLRTRSTAEYAAQLDAVLGHARIRFHVKQLLLQWLASIEDPRREEWESLDRHLAGNASLRPHMLATVDDRPPWFDLLDALGVFDQSLATGSPLRVDEVVWLLGRGGMLKTRSARIAALLAKHRKEDDDWKRRLLHVCRFGEVYHSTEMFRFFLTLIADGTLDDAKPNFAINDSWWMTLYAMADHRPAFASQAIGVWLDRLFVRFAVPPVADAPATEARDPYDRIREYINNGGEAERVIELAAREPLAFADALLPRVAEYAERTAEPSEHRLQRDAIWWPRGRGRHRPATDILLECLAQSLEALARTSPSELDRRLAPWIDRNLDSVAFLVLRAWAAAPQLYAGAIVRYLAADPARFEVGYAFGDSSGTLPLRNGVSLAAVGAASRVCTSEDLGRLEEAILALRDPRWVRPQHRGLDRLHFLRAVDPARLGSKGRGVLLELEAKFPGAQVEARMGVEFTRVQSPIADDKLAKMSNQNWVAAMEKYAGSDRMVMADVGIVGGESELASALRERVKADPGRFAGLALEMPDTLPASYFDAILHGVAEVLTESGGNAPPRVGDAAIAGLVVKTDGLPGRPCGRGIAWLLRKWSSTAWSKEIVEILCRYATSDPDPASDRWEQYAALDRSDHVDAPYVAGINSVRGAAADTLAHVLFDRPELVPLLMPVIDTLAHDPSVAVRACAVFVLLAILHAHRETAITWFLDCVDLDEALLGTGMTERFLQHATHRDYKRIRVVLQRMLVSAEAKTAACGARQTCLAALAVPDAESDARAVEVGNAVMRMAAADVYAKNVGNDEVGAKCRARLLQFFADDDPEIRTEAASAFRSLAALATDDQSLLLTALLESSPTPDALRKAVDAIAESPVKLPGVVCEIGRRCIEAFRNSGGDMRTAGPMVAQDLAKIVVRLYSQSDAAVRGECLDLIDSMSLYFFHGLSEELDRLDR